EDSGRGVLASHSEPRGQVFIDRKNFVVVIRLDENVANQNPPNDGAEGELQVGVVAVAEAFSGRAEERAGTGFSGDKRSKDRPPWNPAAAKGKVFQIVFLSAHAQADKDDDDEVEEEDAGVDGEARVHVG